MRKKLFSVTLVMSLVFGLFCVTESAAVSYFGGNEPSKSLPAALNINDIWFYNADRNKTIPEIDPDWIAVVFRPAAKDFESYEPAGISIEDQVRDLLAQQSDLADYYYDKNLAEDACFFRLRPDMKTEDLPSLFASLNNREAVLYTHPALKIQGRTFAFFNAFTLAWKAGVTEDEKAALLAQVPVIYDTDHAIYRVDVFQKSFFHVLNLLAEDIRVSRAAPYLVEIQPSIQGELTVGLAGGNLGDRIPFSLRIEFSSRVAIEPSSLARISLRPLNIQKELFDVTFLPYDYTKAILRSPILITGEIRFYAPGDYILPAVEIKYHCPECSAPQDRAFQTKPVPVRISSLVPADQRESRLIVPSDPPEMHLPIKSIHHAAKVSLIVSMVCLLLVIACAAWCLQKGFFLRREKKRLLLEKRDAILAGQLRSLLIRGTADEPWVFLSDVSSLFREYLGCRYKIAPVPSGGSGAVFWEAVGRQLPPGVGLKVKAIIESIDRVAAQDQVDDTAMQAIRHGMQEILDHTAPRTADD